MIDGTFNAAPKLFCQMVTIHALLDDGWVIPSVYILLPGKLTTLYTAALEALDSLPQVDLDPQTVLADYELAIRNSVSSIWPSTVVRGCLFQFKQAMLRNAGSMGLASFYKIIGSPVRRAIQLLGALAFVPEGDVYEVYHKIKPTLTDDVGVFSPFIPYLL